MRWSRALARPRGLVGPDVVPHAVQDNDWGCGPCAVATAAAVIGIWADPMQWAARIGTTADGSSAGAVVRAMRVGGLTASVRKRVGIGDVRKWLNRGDRVIIAYIHGADHWVVVPWFDPGHAVVGVVDSLATDPYLLPWNGGGDGLLDGYAIVVGRRA